jgi:hypothetical protein
MYIYWKIKINEREPIKYYKRKIDSRLLEWKDCKRRKPLLLRGGLPEVLATYIETDRLSDKRNPFAQTRFVLLASRNQIGIIIITHT